MDGSRVVTMLTPEKRIYPAEGQETADTAIRTTGLRDLYLALGDDRGNGRWTIRAYVSPLGALHLAGRAGDGAGRDLSLWGRLRVQARRAAARRAAGRMKRVIRFPVAADACPRRPSRRRSPTLSPIPRRRRAPAPCSGNCAAWSARAKASTNPARPWPPICAIWCASRSRTEKATARSRIILVARYGDFILMQPPLQADTYILWLAPFVVLLGAGGVAFWVIRRARPSDTTRL